MKLTTGRSRWSRNARGAKPPYGQRRVAQPRRAWFATSAAIAIAAALIIIAGVAAFASRGETAHRPPAAAPPIASSIAVSPDMKAQRAGLGVAPLPPPAEANPVPHYTFAWPAEGQITEGMTSVHPLGIDIGAAYGASIRAVRAGTVVTAGGDPCCSYGYHVIVEHPDGWRSLYAHLSEISVEVGAVVKQGDLVGLAGDSGKAHGTHLHFELQTGYMPVNPLNYLEPFRSYVVAEIAATGQDAARGESQAAAADTQADADASPDAETQVADAAISTAIPWLEEQGEAIYLLNPASCYAQAAGPNWAVRCGVTNTDCSHNPDCPTTVEACVFRSLELIAPRCSGY